MPQEEGPSVKRSSGSGERRQVTLLFSDMCDYTSLSEVTDPEDIDRLRQQLESLANHVIEKHGGAVTQYYGDGILAVFGLPNAAEHDVRSALDAALELRERTRALKSEIDLPPDFELRMHFGVHCGLVFARLGDMLHGRYELTGDPVNTAARLCAAAERDQILVSEAAMSGIEPFYDAALVPGLKLKGKRLSVPAYRLKGPTDVRTRFEASTRRGLTAFVNRHDELARLTKLVRDAADSGTRTTGLWGGPGMGKTRMLEEFTRRHAASDVLILRGTCESYGTVVPLQPLIQIVRQALKLQLGLRIERTLQELRARCSEIGRGLPAHVDVLANVLALETGASPAMARTIMRGLADALCALIASSSARVVVLVVDDWQWVDDLSYEVVRSVVGRTERGLLLLLAAREHAAHEPLLEAAELIELGPLRADDSDRVVRSLLPNALELGLSQNLYRRSGGNPLFLEELCRLLPPTAASSAIPGSVPHTVHGVIQTRLERLPAEDLRLLRTASVIGNEWSRDLLGELTGDAGLATVLERVVASDLVRLTDEPGGYRFKHGIAREVVYESVLLSERRAIHGAIAERLLQRAANGGTAAPHETLAHHFLGAGRHELAAHHAEFAGDRAATAAALDRAQFHYGTTALSELDRLELSEDVKRRWLKVSVKWARAWVYNQSADHLEVLERAKGYADELGEWHARADLDQMGAWICYALGDQARAIAQAEHGLEIAQRVGNAKLVAQLTSNLGQCYAAAGEYPRAVELIERAIDLKQRGATGRQGAVPVGFAYALATLATLHADRGDFAQAHSQITRALDAVHNSGNPIEASMLALQSMMEIWRGDWASCSAICTRAARTAERVHGPYVFTISQAMNSYCRFRLDGDPQHYRRVCEASDWLEARGMGLYLSMVYGLAAEASLIANDFLRAGDYARRALARADARDPFGEAVGYRVLAALEARNEGEATPAALDYMQRAAQAAARRGSQREAALNDAWLAQLSGS